MREYRETPLKIELGEIIVNGLQTGTVIKEGDGFAAIDIDLTSKYAEVLATGGDSIYLAANEHTLHVDETRKNEATVIKFPEFDGYDIYCCNVGRYTLQVVLIKNPYGHYTIEEENE